MNAPAAWRPWSLRGVAGLLLLYLAAHFLVRMALSPTLGIDDAEQALFAQQRAWGYRFRQPPLYSWLLIPAFDLFGVNAAAMSLVRYLLIGLYYLFFHLTARRLIRDERLAALATASNLLIYVFAFYAHHDLTHTTILSTAIAAGFYLLTRLLDRPSLGNYLLLGLVFALGLLSKWNFAILAVALPLAMLLLRPYRGFLLTWKTLAAILVMAAVSAPTLLWMQAHGQEALALAGRITAPGGAGSGALSDFLHGSAALAKALLLFPLPFLPLFLLFFWRPLRRALQAETAPTNDPLARHNLLRLLGLYIVIAALLHWLLVPAVGARVFTERWMHPVLIPLPILLFLALEGGAPSLRALKGYAGLILAITLLVLGGRLVQHALGADYCGRCRALVPFAALTPQIAALGFTEGTILVEEFHTGGNLRVGFPRARLAMSGVAPEIWPPPAVPAGTTGPRCLVAWRVGPESDGAPEPPPHLASYLREALGLTATAPALWGVLEAAMPGSATKRYRLGYALYDRDLGDCR